jgi:hypothetical protein
MKRPGKRIKRVMRELSREAFSRQQHAHLKQIASKVDSWASEHITDEDLASFLWEHFSGPAKELRDRQAYLDPEILVASAVADGLLGETEIPEEVREDIMAKAKTLAQLSRSRVYQFRITLKGIEPVIWRKIVVPDHYTFWDLHVAIQDSMGWQDYHLHEFRVRNPTTGRIDRIGIRDPDGCQEDEPVLSSSRVPIARVFALDNSVADYIYDFGDDWEHSIILEDIQPGASDTKYPACLGGERACPPEDVGGIPGYQQFVVSLADPDDPEHDRNLEWVGGSFAPDAFNPRDVKFDDPQERWNRAFEQETESNT